MKTACIFIAAYNCPAYIMDCVQSIRNQRPVPGWRLDMRIGVDGCTRTADVLRKNHVPFYWSDKNHGAYIIRNSLIHLRPADAYIYFDADDAMLPNHCHKNLSLMESCHAVMTGKIQTDSALVALHKNPRIERGGAITFDAFALAAVGGFYRWRVAGDTDFMERLEMAGIRIYKCNVATYLRRRHPGAVTRSKIYGIRTDYRNHAWAEMTAQRNKGVVKIRPTIIKLIEVK